MYKGLIVIAVVAAIALFGFLNNNAYAVNYDIKDQPSCISISVNGTSWNAITNTCKVEHLSSLISGDSLTVEHGITLVIAGGSLNNGGNVTNFGIINIFISGTIVNSGTIANFGTITNGGAINNSGTIANFGTIHNNINAGITSSGTIANFGTVESGGTINNSGTIANFGTLRNFSNGNINNNGTIHNYTHNTILNSGIIKNCGGIIDNLGTLVGHPISNTCSALGSGLVAEWKFENNVQDTSGNGNNGVLTGTTFVTGKVGQALNFDGVSSVQVANSPFLNFGSSGNFSISFWMKSSQNSGDGVMVIHRPNNDGQYKGYSVEDFAGTMTGKVRDGSAHEVIVESTSNVNDNSYHHIAFVVDRKSQTEKLYVDGALQATSNISTVGDITQNNVGISMGGQKFPDTPANFYSGILDQARVYNKALSNSEITTLFNEH